MIDARTGATLVALALGLSACDESGAPPAGSPGPRQTAAAPVRVPEPREARRLATGPTITLEEGAPDEAQVLARFQRALDAGPESDVVACIHPATRRAWLESWVVELALESTAAPLDDGRVRDEKAAMRALLAAYGVGGRPPSLDERAVRETLLAEVRDRDALLVALLGYAAKRGAPRDPVAAMYGRRHAAPSGMASALARLVEATRGAQLVRRGPLAAPTEESEGRFTRFVEADAGPRSLRFRREGEVVWLDES